MGRQTSFLTRAPSNHVTPLRETYVFVTIIFKNFSTVTKLFKSCASKHRGTSRIKLFVSKHAALLSGGKRVRKQRIATRSDTFRLRLFLRHSYTKRNNNGRTWQSDFMGLTKELSRVSNRQQDSGESIYLRAVNNGNFFSVWNWACVFFWIATNIPEKQHFTNVSGKEPFQVTEVNSRTADISYKYQNP